MSIQDHEDRAEQYLQAFPIVEDLVVEYIDWSDNREDPEDEVEEDIKFSKFEAESKKLLEKYISKLSISKLKEKMAVVKELQQLTGFLFWQPTYAYLIGLTEKLIYKAFGKIGGKSTLKKYGKKHFKKAVEKREENKENRLT